MASIIGFSKAGDFSAGCIVSEQKMILPRLPDSIILDGHGILMTLHISNSRDRARIPIRSASVILCV